MGEVIDKTKLKWWAWHKKNPRVWVLFQKFTLEAIRSGRKHYSLGYNAEDKVGN